MTPNVLSIHNHSRADVLNDIFLSPRRDVTLGCEHRLRNIAKQNFLRKPPLNRSNEATRRTSEAFSVNTDGRLFARSRILARVIVIAVRPVGLMRPRHRPAQMPRNRSFVFGNIALALKIVSGCVDPLGSWRRRPVAVLAGIQGTETEVGSCSRSEPPRLDELPLLPSPPGAVVRQKVAEERKANSATLA